MGEPRRKGRKWFRETPSVTPRNLAGRSKAVRAFLHSQIGPSEQRPRLESDVLTFLCDTNPSSTLAEGKCKGFVRLALRNGEKNGDVWGTDVMWPPAPIPAGLTDP